MKQTIKYMFLLLVGGSIYFFIEQIFRGYSHWTMFALGGICFVLIGCLNDFYTWEMALISQMLISAIIITVLEFLTGLVVNIWLGWGVWDYSRMPYNILGQICLLYTNTWFLLSLAGILLDDWLRHWIFKEEKPRYKLF